MYLFILLTSLLVINLSNIKIPVREGCDERFSLEYDKDKEILYIIQKNQYNLDLLKKLQSTLSVEEKINAIKMNDFTPTYKPINVKAGGLMDDWNFDIS